MFFGDGIDLRRSPQWSSLVKWEGYSAKVLVRLPFDIYIVTLLYFILKINVAILKNHPFGMVLERFPSHELE